jgi:tetratricopeptide (TPR) repeat protein
MKKSIVVLMVVFAILAVAQETPQQPATPGQPAAAAPQQQKKEIKDPAEYNAYMAALKTTDPNQKAIALEGFLQQFPNSVMKPDALELLMAAYEQAGNAAKVTETAQRLLQVDPNNLKALALLTYTSRAQASANPATAQQSLAEAGQYAARGLQALQTAQKPEGMTDPDWQKLKTQVGVIFNGAAGQNDFAQKNYPAAVQHLGAAVQADPTNLSNVYPLALAYLESTPPNPLGLWYIARAVALTAQAPAQSQQIAKYGRAQYIRYHGGDDGWNELMQQAAASPEPPAGFTIKPAPTPAEQAANLVQSTPVKDMSFDQFQLIFTSGNEQAAQQVWDQIKGKPIAFQAKVIESSPAKLSLAATYDDIQANKTDVELTMVADIPARFVPKVGTETQVQGVPVSYTANPFMIVMDTGKLIGKETPAAKPPAAKKAPVRKKP